MTMRRPLIGIALMVMLGTWCGVMVPGASLLWLLAGAASLLPAACALEWVRRSVSGGTCSRAGAESGLLAARFADLFVYLAILLVAWFSVGMRVDNPSGRTLSSLMDRPREGVELVGVVCDDPVVRKFGDGSRAMCRLRLRVEGIHRVVQWQRARGRVRTTLILGSDGRCPRYGERWRFAGVLTDYARFPAGQGRTRPAREWIRSRYTFRADASESVYLSDGHGFFLLDWCFRMRRRCAEFLARGISHRPDVVGVLQALLLGYRQGLPDTLQQDFRASGTYHILAISGLHVAVLTLFIILVLRARGISRVYWFVFLAPCLVLFALSTGMRPSTIRGTVMALLFFLGPLVNRKTDIPSAIAVAALIILAVAPFQFFDYGFILSFTVVTGLIVLCPILLHEVKPLIERDPLRLEPEPAYLRIIRRVARFVLFGLVGSFAAWLAATPLIARWFNLVSIVAPLANLLLVPLVPLVLLAGYLSIFFGLWFPLLGEIFNFANVVLVSVMISYVGFMARLRYASFFVQSPPLWSVGLWFVTLFAWVSGRTRVWISGAVCLVLAMGIGLLFSMSRVDMEVMNVEGSAVCFVNVPGSADLLMDAGPRFRARRLVRDLRRRGVDRLHALVLTRADARHAGGAQEILRSMPVRELWCSSTNMRSAAYQNAIADARKLGVMIRTMAQGDSGTLPGGVTWSVLQPVRKAKYRSADEASLVMLFTRKRASLLFVGASSAPAESRGAARDESVRPQAQVLVEERTNRRPVEQAGDDPLTSARAWWRLVCVPSQYPVQSYGPRGRSAPTENDRAQDVILPPGQGIRVDFDPRGARIERLR